MQGYTACTAGQTGCDRYDLAVGDPVLEAAIASDHISARVERVGPIFRPPPRVVDNTLTPGAQTSTSGPRLEKFAIVSALSTAEIRRIDLRRCSDWHLQAAEARFRDEISAVMSPQTLTNRPFPLLPGLGMYLCVRLRREVSKPAPGLP